MMVLGDSRINNVISIHTCRWRVSSSAKSPVLNAGSSWCHAATHITWPILSERRSNQQHSRGVPETWSTHSPGGRTAITAQEIQSSTSLGAKCKIQQQCKRGVRSFLSPTSNPHWLINVFEMLEDLIKDTYPPIEGICWGTEQYYNCEKTNVVFSMDFSTTELLWDFYETSAELLVSSLARWGSEMERLDERGEARRDEWRWEVTAEGRADWQIWKWSQEGDRDTNFSLTSSLYLPFKKRERVRPNKTFIIPGKLFNVFDITRLKGGRERERWKEKRERGGGSMSQNGWWWKVEEWQGTRRQKTSNQRQRCERRSEKWVQE